MKTLALSLLLAFAGTAAAQSQTPAPQPQPQPQDATPPAPKKPLNLSLDPVDQRSNRITFEPRNDKKPPAEQPLPGMGGERTRAWEPPSDKIFPPDTNPNIR
ncbi:MAG: hypothetical protein JOZ85_14600 [Betaproteobacteria bacterium]|nr:hypothetical protein [Betaproteobacteria bacterium]